METQKPSPRQHWQLKKLPSRLRRRHKRQQMPKLKLRQRKLKQQQLSKYLRRNEQRQRLRRLRSQAARILILFVPKWIEFICSSCVVCLWCILLVTIVDSIIHSL